LIEEGLRKVIEERRHSQQVTLPKVTFRGNGLKAELADGSWNKIRVSVFTVLSDSDRHIIERI
jgi:hypothetical protein